MFIKAINQLQTYQGVGWYFDRGGLYEWYLAAKKGCGQNQKIVDQPRFKQFTATDYILTDI
jgi:hypothetical protein